MAKADYLLGKARTRKRLNMLGTTTVSAYSRNDGIRIQGRIMRYTGPVISKKSTSWSVRQVSNSRHTQVRCHPSRIALTIFLFTMRAMYDIVEL